MRPRTASHWLREFREVGSLRLIAAPSVRFIGVWRHTDRGRERDRATRARRAEDRRVQVSVTYIAAASEARMHVCIIGGTLLRYAAKTDYFKKQRKSRMTAASLPAAAHTLAHVAPICKCVLT